MVRSLFQCWNCGGMAATQVAVKGCAKCGGEVCGNADQTLYTCADCYDRLLTQMARQAFDQGGPRCDSLRGRLATLARWVRSR